MSGNEAPTQVLPPAPGQVGTEALTQLLGNAPLPCTPPFAVHDLAALSPRSRHLYSEAPTQILPPTQLPEGQRSPSHVAHTPPAAVILAGFDYERSVARLKANAGNDPIPNLPYSSGSSHSSDDEASKKDNQDTASDSTYPLSLLPPPPPPPPLRMQMPEFANDGGSGVGAPIGLPPATRFTSTIPSSPAVFCAGDESPADTPAAATTMRSANADPFGRKRSPCPVRPTTIPCTGSNDTTTFSGTAADDSTLLFPGATPSQVPIPNPNTVLKASARAMPLLVDTPHGQSDAPPVAVAAAAAAPGAHRTPENDDSFMDIDGNDSLLGGVMSADPLGPKHPHHGGALDIFASSASPIPLSHLENASLAVDSYVPPAFGDSVMPDPSHAPLDELSSANTVMLTAESMDLGETPVKRFRSMVGPFSSLGRQYEPPVTYPDASVSQTLKHVTTDVPAVPLALQLGDGDEDSIPIGATSPEHPNAPMDVGPKSDDTSLFSFPTTSPPTRAVSEPPLPPLPHPKPTRRRILANGAQEQVERALQRRRAHIFPAGTPIRILSPIAQSPDTVPPQARSPQGTPSARNTSLLPAVRRMTLSSCSDSDDEPPAVTAMRRVIHTSDDDHDHDDDNDVDSDTDKTDELIAHSPPERGPRKRRRTAFDRGGTKLATVARPTTPTAPVAPAMAMAAPTTTGRKRPRLDPVLTSPLPPSSLESSRTRPARRSRPTSFRRQESSSDEPDDPNDPSYETQSMVETSAPPAPTPRYQRPSPIVPAVAAVAASGGKRRGLQAAADSPLSEISGSPPPPPPPAGIDVTAPGPIIRLSSRRGTLTVEKEPPPPTRSYATDDLVWARTAGAAQQFYVGRIRGRASLSAENEVQYRIKLLSGERLQVPFEHIRPYVPLDIGQHAYAYVTTSEIAPVVIVEVAEDEADEYIVETAERRRVHVAVDRMILSVDQIRSMDRHRTPLARDLITPPQPPPVLARQESAPTPMHPSRSTQRRRNGRTRATRPGPASSPLRERPRTADPMDVDHMDVDHQLQSPPVSEPAAVTMRPTSIKATSTPARAAPPPATAPTLETAPSTAVKAASNRALPQRMSPRRRQSSRIFDGLHFVITMIKSNDAVDGSSQIPDPDEIPMTVVSGNPQFERPLIERLITELGGTLVENVAGLGAMNDQTHPTVFCIASAPRRSHKFLLALALGIPRISCQWVLDCFSKASLIPHTFYQLPNGNSTELRGYISAIFAPSIFAGRSFAIQLPHAAREEWRLTLTAYAPP
ncbi:hypothetical protein BC828DRAFT_65282 [Blastocladiella britannica]|nr:hypothetical protein BC828DRAFT_65282 [Blastocladiella britannica]